MRPITLLDCTIRDGNYVVDFNFTAPDTSLLVGELSRLGFSWIEIGHGLGLGAARSGKGTMPCSDEEAILSARDAAGDALIGAFFIPGLGTTDDLRLARDAGLDFVRIGDDVSRLERTFPFVEEARRLGMQVCVNMMKSYVVDADGFADRVVDVQNAGADVAYCVDSAGGMLPAEIGRYFAAARGRSDLALGFHGHNNLMMAVQNCVVAIENGASFIDSTLCGLGRSAGNAPSEIVIAVLERMGYDTGMVLQDVLDVIDAHVWPLVSGQRAHDSMGVTAGYSLFHSSFLSKVLESALRHGADLRRLVERVALHDPESLDETYLESAALDLSGTRTDPSSDLLRRFDAPGISYNRISNSLESTRVLVEGMAVTCAKKLGARPVLHLCPTDDPAPGMVVPQIVLENEDMVLGRVQYGDLDALKQVLEVARTSTTAFLVATTDGWARNAYQVVVDAVGVERTLGVRDRALRRLFLLEALDRALIASGDTSLLVVGDDPVVNDALEDGTTFRQVYRLSSSGSLSSSGEGRSISLTHTTDWREIDLRFDVILCAGAPGSEFLADLHQVLATGGKIIIVGASHDPLIGQSDRLVRLNLDDAFRGVLSRAQATSDLAVAPGESVYHG